MDFTTTNESSRSSASTGNLAKSCTCALFIKKKAPRITHDCISTNGYHFSLPLKKTGSKQGGAHWDHEALNRPLEYDRSQHLPSFAVDDAHGTLLLTAAIGGRLLQNDPRPPQLTGNFFGRLAHHSGVDPPQIELLQNQERR